MSTHNQFFCGILPKKFESPPVKLEITIPSSLLRDLNRFADDDDISLNELCFDILDDWVGDYLHYLKTDFDESLIDD